VSATRFRTRCASLAACTLVAVAPSLFAQERLVGRQSAGFGLSYEGVQFGGRGLRQFNFAGLDSSRITGVRQASMPVTTAVTFNSGWRLDLTALYASSTVTYGDAGNANDRRTATLSGVSDVRIRATGAVLRERLVVTAGINVPTGRTSLTNGEFAVLRIMAAPSLGLGSTPVGAGASGTMGLVVPRRVGAWSTAVGGSYEYRGRYQPVAALLAGAPSVDFQPGGVFRASVTGDRTVGAHRLSIAMAADVFAEDELRTPVATGGTSAAAARTVVRLGPVYSADVQMLLSVPRLRQFMGYTSYRWRAPFSRNGQSVRNSSGQYLDGGVRAAMAIGPQRDLVLGADARLHAGLGVDEGLPTSGVASGSVSAGVELRRGLLSIQPYLRAQNGVLRQRGVGDAAPSQSFRGFAGGLVAVTRF